MSGGFTLELFEQMLDNPQMAAMLMPNMPEGMRDPAMIKNMLKNPQYRSMLEQSFNQMNSGDMDPAMMEMMNKNMGGAGSMPGGGDMQAQVRAPPLKPTSCVGSGGEVVRETRLGLYLQTLCIPAQFALRSGASFVGHRRAE